MRLLLDEHLSVRHIGRLLTQRGYDVLAVTADPKLVGLEDEQLLEHALEQKRIIVTCDGSDFSDLARQWWDEPRPHAGILIAWSHRNHEFKAVADAVSHLLEVRADQEEWMNLVLGV